MCQYTHLFIIYNAQEKFQVSLAPTVTTIIMDTFKMIRLVKNNVVLHAGSFRRYAFFAEVHYWLYSFNVEIDQGELPVPGDSQ